MTNYLITGAGRGIGLEMTKQALAAGHSVIGSVRPGADAALLDLATDSGGSLGIITFDVRQPETIAAAATALDRPIDVLVNNAGIIGHQPQSTSDMDFDGFSDTLAVNTLGPLRVVHAFLPHLRRGNRPRIVTISSKMGSFSSQSTDRVAYRVSKAAVNKLMQALSGDLKPEGITVVSMHPGWVRTDMGGSNADISVQESASGILSVAERLDLDRAGAFINYDGSPIPW